MLRVAMITDYPDDAERVDGGVQSVTKYLVDALCDIANIDLHVVVFRYGIDKGRVEEANGFTKHTLPGGRLGMVTALREDQATLATCLDRIQPKLVHGQGAGHNGIIASRCGYPSVITIHGVLAEEAQYQSTFTRRLRHRLENSMSERHCIARATNTIVISPYVAKFYEGRITGDLHLIPNPTAKAFFDIKRNEEPSRLLFAGRITPIKGVLDLVKAVGRLSRSRSIQLALAGSTDERDYVRHLQSEMRSLGIGDQVEILGNLDSRSFLSELSRASMLVLPSYQETAPMVIQEAMAAGLPVVATRVGGTEHQIVDGETGFLVGAGDIDALAEKMETLLADKALRDSFGTSGKSVAEREFRAATVADKTVAVYEQVLKSGTGHRSQEQA